MGCDIHAHIEYQPYTPRGEHDWWGFAALQGEPRYYRVFGALTNGEVRSEGCDMGLVAPRGYPTDASSDTNEDYYEHDWREVEPATADIEAEKWRATIPAGGVVSVHRSQSLTWGMGEPHDGRTDHTSLSGRWPCPDWHSASWLAAPEFRAALATVPDHGHYWDAVLAAMEALDANGTPSRIVFWFDN